MTSTPRRFLGLTVKQLVISFVGVIALGSIWAVGLAMYLRVGFSEVPATIEPAVVPTQFSVSQAGNASAQPSIGQEQATKFPPAPTVQQFATATPTGTEAVNSSSNGELIAFTSVVEGRRDIWIIQKDGVGLTNITGNQPNAYADAPAWSPDGKFIAFDAYREGNRDIYIQALDGGGEMIRLTQDAKDDCYPEFSPDGKQIVFMSERDGNREIYVMEVDGTNLIRLTDHPADDYEPTWSPDGTQIVFVSRRNGNSDIYVMNADGSNLHLIVEARGLDWRPDWSPSGEWIVFESWRDDNADIYIVRPDGSELTQITDHFLDDGHPSFAPDGRQIVFHSNREGYFELYSLDLQDLTEVIKIETLSLNNQLPSWSP
ncbi:MAG: hypothetical protein DWQ07_17925 [Chloroflexi bacterium]|nr:MAG: hypothetical protein DWQ07_17925 [Chloroflexota bacterium]